MNDAIELDSEAAGQYAGGCWLPKASLKLGGLSGGAINHI